MPKKLPKAKRQRRSSSDRPIPKAKQVNLPSAAANKISTEQMTAILIRARQTVKPIIKREAENEIVSEEILNFKMGEPELGQT